MKNSPNFTLFYADPENATFMEAFLVDIVEAVHSRIIDSYEAEIPEIMEMHPKTLINLIAGNLVVNLVRGSIIPDTTLSMRREVIEDTLKELTDMIRFVWQTLETTMASEDKPN